MILSFAGISLENLPEGNFTLRRLEVDEATHLLSAAQSLIGNYDFGPVPNEKKECRFRELLAAIEERTGVIVPPQIFFFRRGGRDVSAAGQLCADHSKTADALRDILAGC